MQYAAISLALGVIAYFVVLLYKPLRMEADADAWSGLRLFSTLLAIFTFVMLVWIAIGHGPGASTETIWFDFFHKNKRLRTFPFFMVASVSFAALVNLHILIRNYRARNAA